jgi:hypothetical protein
MEIAIEYLMSVIDKINTCKKEICQGCLETCPGRGHYNKLKKELDVLNRLSKEKNNDY